MTRRPSIRRLAVLAAFAPAFAGASDARALSTPDEEAKALPCRPTIACTADLVKPGQFEVETGMLFRSMGGVRQWSFPFLAKLTVTERVQLQAGSNGYTALLDASPAARYFDDVTAGVKLHVLDQAAFAPSLSVSGTFGLPVASAPGYVPADDAFAIAYVTKDVGFVHADLNLGLNELGIGASARGQEWAALALSVALPAPFGAMVENYYFTDALPFAGRDGGCLFALSLTPRPWLVFDFGGDAGYFPSSRAYSAFVGMTIIPVALWR